PSGLHRQDSTHSELLSHFFAFLYSVSFSRFSAHPAVSRASQLVYLIKLPRESQHLFFSFFDFFTKFFIFRTNPPHQGSSAPIQVGDFTPIFSVIVRVFASSAISPCKSARGMLQ
ncbi:MAG: hypothetical protein IJA83_11795, partial [Clostridia bacterium]|nr:hypothetical protein [Clostridia bacterium]